MIKKNYEDIFKSLDDKDKSTINDFIEAVKYNKENNFLLHKTIQSKLKRFKKKNQSISNIFTNGALITSDNLKIFLSVKKDDVSIGFCFEKPINRHYNMDVMFSYHFLENRYNSNILLREFLGVGSQFDFVYNEDVSKVETFPPLVKDRHLVKLSKETEDIGIFEKTDIISSLIKNYDNVDSLKDFILLTNDIKIEDNIFLKALFENFQTIDNLNKEKTKINKLVF